MTILALGEPMEPITPEELSGSDRSVVVVCSGSEAPEAMALAGMNIEGELSLADVTFCKIESQQECLAGSLCIPKLLDVLGSRYRIQLFINQRHILIVDDGDFSLRLITQIQRSRTQPGITREKFLYHFLTQIINRDLEVLSQYERRLMGLEERVMEGQLQGFESQIVPIRKELLTLRGYYDELTDLGRELEQDENQFFAKKQLKFFGTVSDRADRMMGRTVHLLDYAQQIRDSYQARVNEQQNRNMQFLTVISTIFFPLTLITGWFGMNFRDMPGLDTGYPWVILLSIVVIIVCIFFFKKKKMF